MKWRETHIETLVKTPPFSVQEVTLADKATNEILGIRYYRLEAPSWVNVLALTPDKNVILVRQPRVGIMANTLETPGGGIDDGEDPLEAAGRELEEETGYRAGQILSLGSINPNPAIMKNRLYMFLALDCQIPSNREHFPDSSESIEVVERPLAEVLDLIQNGKFENALGALTVLMAMQFYKI